LVFSGTSQPSSVNTTSLFGVSQLRFVSPVASVTRTFSWAGSTGYTASGTFSYIPSAAVGGVVSATGSAASGGATNDGLSSLNISFKDPSQSLLGSYTNATGGTVTYVDLVFNFDTQASQFVKDFQLGGSYSLNGQATAPPAPFSELDGPSGFLDDTSGTSGLTLTGSATSNLVPFTLSGSSIQIAGGGSIVTESPRGGPSLTDTIATPVVSSAGGFTVTLGGSVGSVRNLLITGPISGTGGLTLNGGSGTLTLTGSNSNGGGTVVSTGTLLLDQGAVVSQAGQLTQVGVTSGTSGALVIKSGSLSDQYGLVGVVAGSSGTATVSGGVWNNSDSIQVGSSGTGVLNVSGGTVTDSDAYVGTFAGSRGEANVSSGTWSTGTNLYVGSSGDGSLNVTGGTVTDTLGIVGFLAGSTGTATVSSGTFSSSQQLQVGSYGNGQLYVSGGKVTDVFGFLGVVAGASGTATVSGGLWENSSNLYVGSSGSGSLLVTGGTVSDVNGFVGTYAGSSGTVAVTGGQWSNSNTLLVGSSGTGGLTISGGNVTDAFGVLGQNAGSKGVVNVSGGSWTTGTSLVVGQSGQGTLNLVDSGTVAVGNGSGKISVGLLAGSQGTLNIGTGGSAGTLATGTIVGGAGAGVVNLNHSGSLDLGASMQGVLTVNQLLGTTILSGTSTYTGDTNVLGGSLIVDGKLGNTAVDVHAGATLGGNGSVGGVVTVLDSGTLAPGDLSPGSVGDLSVGSLLLGGVGSTSTTLLDIHGLGTHPGAAGSDYDSVNITNTNGLEYGGKLQLDFWNTQAFADWSVFRLFDFTGATTDHFGSIQTLASVVTDYNDLIFTHALGAGDYWVWEAQAGNGQTLLFYEASGVLVVVPEPATIVFAGIGIAISVWRRYRRRPRILSSAQVV
jgi:T5SS/PEP-CTERM-associated repeat protein